MWLLLGIFLGVPALILGGAAISVAIDEAKQKKREAERIQEEYQSLYEGILQSKYVDNEANIRGEIKELPQLTFERWLTFYNTNPENWDMTKFYTNIQGRVASGYNYLVPTYYKITYHKGHNGRDRKVINKVGIPIFWKDANEMRKFDEWFRHEYKNGNAAIYERKRDENLEQLAKFLQEDVVERRRQLQEQYAQIVDDVKIDVPNSNISLTLNSSSNQARELTQADYQEFNNMIMALQSSNKW